MVQKEYINIPRIAESVADLDASGKTASVALAPHAGNASTASVICKSLAGDSPGDKNVAGTIMKIDAGSRSWALRDTRAILARMPTTV